MNTALDCNPFQSLTNLFLLALNILKTLLLFRFFLKFFTANPAAPFVEFIYTTSQPFITLFGDVFPTRIIENQYTFEPTSLLALVVISVLGQVIYQLLDSTAFIHHRHRQRKKATVADQQYHNQKSTPTS